MNDEKDYVTKSEFGDFRSEMCDFKAEMYEFKAEMYEFKTEMYEFKSDMYEFREEMRVFKEGTIFSFDKMHADFTNMINAAVNELRNESRNNTKMILEEMREGFAGYDYRLRQNDSEHAGFDKRITELEPVTV